MSSQTLLNTLNDAQREAVSADPGHILVLAGAGSGKTRVLVHRIAWLIETGQATPANILAVTFTNKAAAEIRNRLQNFLNIPTRHMWAGTFHSLANRMLRIHWSEAKLSENFHVLDSEDQLRIIRRIIKAMNLNDEEWVPKKVQWYINDHKDHGRRTHHLKTEDPYNKTLLQIYQQYEKTCETSSLVDFAELLLRGYELLQQNHTILEHYQHRFRHILVDEFQDTNAVQYAWIRLLVGAENYLMVVGDDDQSIYGWRGAQIENIQHMQRDFSATKVVRLEQNYRSTNTILSAANALIANNDGRMGKNLWTDGEVGEPIRFYAALNEIDEAHFILNNIQQWIRAGNRYNDIAILYRSNAQSRALEQVLVEAGVPYRIYGGLRFYERAEIKDALAYLRLMQNPHDDAAFDRIVNTPTRGIGDRSLAVIRELAREHGSSLWQATHTIMASEQLSARTQNALQGFVHLIDTFAAEIKELPLGAQISYVLEHSGLREHFGKEKGESGRSRLENLAELVTAADEFAADEEHEDEVRDLAAFLSQVALDAGDNAAIDTPDYVQMMTLHSAKGLEFPWVFLCGLEEGLFPHQMCLNDTRQLEEERRLCYVGITRAMQRLTLTYAKVRRVYGREMQQRRSRFLAELPQNTLAEVSLTNTIRPPKIRTTAVSSTPDSKIGQRVQHPLFGEGIILDYEGQGEHLRVQVKFRSNDCKWLIAKYAKLETI
ncbi:DNA helicase II [soil metagenome]